MNKTNTPVEKHNGIKKIKILGGKHLMVLEFLLSFVGKIYSKLVFFH